MRVNILGLTLCLLVSSADNFANNLKPDQNFGHDLYPNCLTLMVFLKEFLEKGAFEKKSGDKNHEKFPRGQRI